MKRILAIALTVLMTAALMGCGGTAEADSAILEQNKALLAENEQLKAQLQQTEQTPQKATIRGSFVATVRQLLPDYVMDDTTPAVALVTQFQDTPFTVQLGPDLIKQVEEGKAYTFTIQDTEVDLTQYPNPDFMLDPAVFMAMNIKIKVSEIAPAESAGPEGPELELSIG